MYTHLALHCGHAQLYDMSVSDPHVTPVYNGTTCVNMVLFCSMGKFTLYIAIVTNQILYQ